MSQPRENKLLSAIMVNRWGLGLSGFYRYKVVIDVCLFVCLSDHFYNLENTYWFARFASLLNNTCDPCSLNLKKKIFFY